MTDSDLARRGLVLLGCGRMGSAMLEGWLAEGLPASSIWVIDPKPSDWLARQCTHLNEALPGDPAVVLVAVKPQRIGTALPSLRALGGGGTLFVSIAAGTTLATLEGVLGAGTPIVRAMPNTPGAVGRGVTACFGNPEVSAAQMAQAEALLAALGVVVRLETEAQMDAVTGLSGSGPAYVFHMIECLAAAGEAEGLDAELAMTLARATVAGAGALAVQSGQTAADLRAAVTSPGGTTEAGLSVLMDASDGLAPLMRATVAAAAARSRNLADG